MKQLSDRVEERRGKTKNAGYVVREGLLPPSVPRSAREISELTGELHTPSSFPRGHAFDVAGDQSEEPDQEIAQQTFGHHVAYPNWSRKMHFRLDELYSARQSYRLRAMFALDRQDRAEEHSEDLPPHQ